MSFKYFATVGLAVALGFSQVAIAADLTPAQRAEFSAKAETAARLVAYGQALKDPVMLRAAANLIGEIGPVAKEIKDGQPVNYDPAALRAEAESYGEAKATSATAPTQCSWFYNCDSYNNCFWDQWC